MRELRGVCEAFRSSLRAHMRITRFRLDVLVPARTAAFVLVDDDPRTRGEDHHRAALRAPAVITVPVRDAQGVVASVTIEDSTRPFLPASARDQVERVASVYAPMVRACLHAGGSWPEQKTTAGSRPRRPAPPR